MQASGAHPEERRYGISMSDETNEEEKKYEMCISLYQKLH